MHAIISVDMVYLYRVSNTLTLTLVRT